MQLKSSVLGMDKKITDRHETFENTILKALDGITGNQREFSQNMISTVQQVQGAISDQQKALVLHVEGMVEKKVEACTQKALEMVAKGGNLDPKAHGEIQENKSMILKVQKEVSTLGLEVSESLKQLVGHVRNLQEAMGTSAVPAAPQVHSVTREDLDALAEGVRQSLEMTQAHILQVGGEVNALKVQNTPIQTPISQPSVPRTYRPRQNPPRNTPMEEASGGEEEIGFRLREEPSPEEKARQNAWLQSGGGWLPMEGGGPMEYWGAGNECRVCPVGVVDPSANFGGFMGMNPVMHQMVKNLKLPTFDDTAEAWPRFIWDFQDYLRKLSPTSEIPEECKLQLFEDALPHTLKDELRLMRRMNPGQVGFSDVMARFEARYGHGGSAKMRKKWSDITMPTSGKITTKILREFQVNFIACASEIKDTNPQEIRRLALQRLPAFMKSWVVEKEQKKEHQKPLLQIVVKEGLTDVAVRNSVRAMVGENPTRVESCGKGVYKVQFSNEDAGKKLLSMHMKPLEGLPRPLQVQLLEQPLEILEMFDLLHSKLAAREKIDTYQAPWERGAREVKSTPKPEKKPTPREEKKIAPQREEKKAQDRVIPAYQHEPYPKNQYLAGFEPPKAQNQVAYYPFRSWRDTVNQVGKGGGASQGPPMAGRGYPGGKGGAKGGGGCK